MSLGPLDPRKGARLSRRPQGIACAVGRREFRPCGEGIGGAGVASNGARAEARPGNSGFAGIRSAAAVLVRRGFRPERGQDRPRNPRVEHDVGDNDSGFPPLVGIWCRRW